MGVARWYDAGQTFGILVLGTGAFNSAEVQQCRKRRENVRIIYTHFLKSGKLLTRIIKENHSNFGANMSATVN